MSNCYLIVRDGWWFWEYMWDYEGVWNLNCGVMNDFKSILWSFCNFIPFIKSLVLMKILNIYSIQNLNFKSFQNLNFNDFENLKF